MAGSGNGSRRDAPLPASAGPRWVYAALAVVLLAVALWVWHPVPAGVWHDDGVYLLEGHALASGQGLRYEGVVGDPPAVKFPPGYPAVLAALWMVFGSLSGTALAASLLNLGAVALAAALFGRWLARSGVVRWPVAVALTALAWISADVWRFAMVPLSEPLFLLASVTALWAALSPAVVVAVALLLVCVMMLRTAGVVVVLAVAGGLALRGRRRAAWTVAVPAALVSVMWSVYSARIAATVPPALSDILGSYGGWLAGQFAASPTAYLARLPAHAIEVARRAVGMLTPGLGAAASAPLAVPFAALSAVGLWSVRRRLPELSLLVPAYLGLLLVWPYVDSRLLSPWMPFLIASVALGFLDLARRGRSVPVRRTLAALGIVWVLAYGAATVGRYAHGWPMRAYRVRADRLESALVALRHADPRPARVGAPELWAALHLHGGWTVAPSARFRPAAPEGVPLWGRPEEQLRLWLATGVDYLVLEQGGLIHGDALNTLEATCPGSAWIVARMPGQMIVRITPDAACRRALEDEPGARGTPDATP